MFIRLTAISLLAAIATPALAQGNASAPQPQPVTRDQLSTRLDTDYADLDANKDGKADSAEILARLKKGASEDVELIKKERDASFARFDADKNGSISRAEFDARVPVPKVRDATEADAKPFLDRFDANKDGAISKDEYRAPTLNNFANLDTNKDGSLSAAEQQAPTPPAAKTPAKKAPVKETPPIGR